MSSTITDKRWDEIVKLEEQRLERLLEEGNSLRKARKSARPLDLDEDSGEKRPYHRPNWHKVDREWAETIIDEDNQQETELREISQTPLADIGLEQVDKLIASVIKKYNEDLYRQSYQAIIKRHPKTEDEMLAIIQEVLVNAISPIMATPQTDNNGGSAQHKPNMNIKARIAKFISHQQDEAQNVKMPKSTRAKLVDEYVNEYVDAVWNFNDELEPQYLFPGMRCPKCKTGLIVSEAHSSICVNCGLTEDYSTIETIAQERLTRWLIANRQGADFIPPRWLMFPKSDDELSSFKKRISNSLDTPTPKRSGVSRIRIPMTTNADNIKSFPQNKG